jgi:hypothetical protein
LDELVDSNNMVRAVDSYVEILNISELNIKTKLKDLAKIDEDIKNYMTLLDTLDKEDKNNIRR